MRDRPCGREFRADIVEHRRGDAIGRDGRQHHGDDAAHRGADEHGLRDRQSLSISRDHVLRVDRRHVVRGIGIVGALAASAHVGADDAPAERGDARRDDLEVARIAREAVQADHRQAGDRFERGVVARVDRKTVDRGDHPFLEAADRNGRAGSMLLLLAGAALAGRRVDVDIGDRAHGPQPREPALLHRRALARHDGRAGAQHHFGGADGEAIEAEAGEVRLAAKLHLRSDAAPRRRRRGGLPLRARDRARAGEAHQERDRRRLRRRLGDLEALRGRGCASACGAGCRATTSATAISAPLTAMPQRRRALASIIGPSLRSPQSAIWSAGVRSPRVRAQALASEATPPLHAPRRTAPPA